MKSLVDSVNVALDYHSIHSHRLFYWYSHGLCTGYSGRGPERTRRAAGGSRSQGEGARDAETKGKGERGRHGLQSQTQQVHGSGRASEPRWGISVMPSSDQRVTQVSECISWVSAVALSSGVCELCVWNAGLLVSVLKSAVLWCLSPAGKGEGFERCLLEAESLLDQSLRLEQAGEVSAALSVVNEAMCK